MAESNVKLAKKKKKKKYKIERRKYKIERRKDKIERRKDKLKQKVKKLEGKNSDEGQTIGWNVKLDLFEPEEIDALKIVKKIGRGGQSEVFEGINKNDSSSSTNCPSSFKHLQRFLLEYEILL